VLSLFCSEVCFPVESLRGLLLVRELFLGVSYGLSSLVFFSLTPTPLVALLSMGILDSHVCTKYVGDLVLNFSLTGCCIWGGFSQSLTIFYRFPEFVGGR